MTNDKQPTTNNETETIDYEKKADEYLNNWKKERADFSNYKKEEERRVSEIIKYSSEGMAIEFLDVLDDLENALRHTPPEVKDKNKDWFSGLEQAIKRFSDLLKGYGIEKIVVEGARFDPAIHEAVEIKDGDLEHLEEIRSGYKLYDKVIRPARVRIIK